MPYIKSTQRHKLDRGFPSEDPGELNYRITRICQKYLADKGACYATYNEIIGVLECVKLEMYRRVVAPYEDQKCRENGDVYA